MNNKGMFYTNVSDYETKEDMMNDFIALRMYDIAKDKEIEEHKNTIATQEQEIERLKELCDKYEEEHKTTFEIWQKDIKENEHLRTALNTKENIIKKAKEHLKESINDYLKDDRNIDGTCNVMCYETIKKRYLKPVLEILGRAEEE